MPKIQSAKKTLRQTKKKTLRNDFFRDAYREARVSFERAIKAKDLEGAKKAFFNEDDKKGNTKKS
jgi:ribosomal protein S20